VPIGHRTAAGRLRWPRSTPPARWGVLGTDTRGDTVEGLSDLLRQHAVDPEAWYGVWLFADWQDLPPATTDVAAVAAVEFEASLRDPLPAAQPSVPPDRTTCPVPTPLTGRAGVARRSPYRTRWPMSASRSRSGVPSRDVRRPSQPRTPMRLSSKRRP